MIPRLSSSSSGGPESPHPALKSIRSHSDVSSPRLSQLKMEEDELFFPRHSPKKKYSHDFSGTSLDVLKILYPFTYTMFYSDW
jgi:hypothetical protein